MLEAKKLEPILLRPFSPDYGSTIEGSDKHQLFPAQTFFNQLIDEHLPDYNFIKNLLVPDCNFSNILAFDIEAVGVEQDWEVDFLFPQIDLAIENDGLQHTEQVQRTSDRRRYEILRDYGIRQHRVAVDRKNCPVYSSRTVSVYNRFLERKLLISIKIIVHYFTSHNGH